MKKKDLITTNQNAKSTLQKVKKHLNLTNKILEKKLGGCRFQFWLPTYGSLTRIQQRAIDSKEPIFITSNPLIQNDVLSVFLKRLINLTVVNKKGLLITNSELLQFFLKAKLENNAPSFICSLEEAIKIDNQLYDEILLFDICTDIKTLKQLQQISHNISISTSQCEENIMGQFPNLKKFDFDESFPAPYEIFNFARQFLPSDSNYNDVNFLEHLKIRNSGVNKPVCYETDSFEKEIGIILNTIFEENPTDNIIVCLPYGKNKNNNNLSVEKYFKALSKKYFCSKYYEGIKINKLYNVVITTYNDIKYIESDILILPQFEKVKNIVDNETIFNAIYSVKNELHIFQETCNDYDDLVEKINYDEIF